MNIIVTGCSRGVGLEICRVLPVAVPMNLRHCSPNTGVNFFLRALTFRIVKMSGRMYSKIIAETR